MSGVSREEPEHPFSPREGQLGRTYWSSSADKNSRPVNNLAWGHIRLWSSRPVASIDLWFHVAWLYWCVMTKFVYGLVLAFALVHLHRTSLQAQAPNNAELMGRVFLLKYGATSGTAFVVTVDDRQYLITAQHVVSGLPDTGGVVGFHRSDGTLHAVSVVKRIHCENPDVDIAILVLGMEIQHNKNSVKVELSTAGRIGQEVYFFGFPQTPTGQLLFTKVKGADFPAPFVKKAMLSAADNDVPNRRVFYFDGFNNRGFSGGPVAWFDDQKQTWHVIAVVSAYVPSIEQLVGVPSLSLNNVTLSPAVLVNSGILVGHSSDSALAAIRKYAAGSK